MNNAVHHPKHYANNMNITVECIMFTRNMSFDLGNAFKYVWRAGHKDAFRQDLEKAVWYLHDAMRYGDKCSLKNFIPFLPVNHMPDWKIKVLCYILDGNATFAFNTIDAILNENTSGCSEGSRLIDSSSVDERV